MGGKGEESINKVILRYIVHEPRAKIWLNSTTHGGKFNHTFSESLRCQLSE